MYLYSFMCRAELLAQQPVLSGAVVFGACVCGRVTTRLVQTCAVTIREPVASTRRPWSGHIKISADGHVHTKQDDLWAKQPVKLPKFSRRGLKGAARAARALSGEIGRTQCETAKTGVNISGRNIFITQTCI